MKLSDFNIQHIPKTLLKQLVFEEEVLQERWDACGKCEFLTKRNRCKRCGCFMGIKSRMSKMKCPIGKWTSV